MAATDMSAQHMADTVAVVTEEATVVVTEEATVVVTEATVACMLACSGGHFAGKGRGRFWTATGMTMA